MVVKGQPISAFTSHLLLEDDTPPAEEIRPSEKECKCLKDDALNLPF